MEDDERDKRIDELRWRVLMLCDLTPSIARDASEATWLNTWHDLKRIRAEMLKLGVNDVEWLDSWMDAIWKKANASDLAAERRREKTRERVRRWRAARRA